MEQTGPFQSAPTTSAPATFESRDASPHRGLELEPRFPPGALLLDRYRIISVQGKGGMGEVYRADDLRLRQQVALKFLSRGLSGDSSRLARLHQEVRIARQVSHPRVCRVHDIAEVDGEAFLTMEFIDGEDLRSLLKRIGRLPEDKGTQIARQLCEGLNAVHEMGIVHRDLKPGNVMIDGRGQVRLTDFGLAAFADSIPAAEFHSGTPAYMAPELLAGGVPTVQSDIFALGLVLYELFTGRRAYPARNRQELARLYQEHVPLSVCELVPGLDRDLGHVIRQCLDKDPAQRPASVLAVANALPKPDSLATALAEGRMPSPEVVANAGTEGSLAPPVATALFVATLLGVVLVAALAGHASVCGLAPLPHSPDALAAKARTILHRLDHTELPADQRHGFYYNFDYLNYTVANDKSIGRWSALAAGESPAVVFWYRQSPQYLVAGGMTPRTYPGRVTPIDPTAAVPGMASLYLDPRGKLVEFAMVPARRVNGHSATGKADFRPLFEYANLDFARAQETIPRYAPPFFAGERMAWDVAINAEGASEPLRVEAAADQGRPIYFKVYQGPWDQPDSVRGPLQPESRLFQYLYAGLFCLAVLGASWLARRNWLRGLGDATGAWRLAIFLFVCHMLSAVLVADHVPSFRDEAVWLMKAVGYAGLWSGLCGLLYFALEPYVRRRWPWRLISWNRLLAGRFRDPMVGRDLLIGALLGIFLTLMHQLGVILPPLFSRPSPLPLTTWLSAFTHVPFHLLMELPLAVKDTLQWFFLLFLLVLFVRQEWLASILVFALALVYNLVQEPELHYFWAALMGATVCASLFVALRFGLLANTVGLFFCYYLYQLPFTMHLSSWYSWQTLIYMAWPILLCGAGFLIARGGQPTFREMI
jgi:serine/threonine-protein kinase